MSLQKYFACIHFFYFAYERFPEMKHWLKCYEYFRDLKILDNTGPGGACL